MSVTSDVRWTNIRRDHLVNYVMVKQLPNFKSIRLFINQLVPLVMFCRFEKSYGTNWARQNFYSRYRYLLINAESLETNKTKYFRIFGLMVAPHMFWIYSLRIFNKRMKITSQREIVDISTSISWFTIEPWNIDS